MVLTKSEEEKLAQAKTLFKSDKLTRDQVDLLLSRKISNTEWGLFSRVPQPIKDYNISRLLEEKKTKTLHQIVAKQAANKALSKRLTPTITAKREARKNNKDKPEPNEPLKIKSLFKPYKNEFKSYKDDFTITKTKTYYNEMYNTESSIWKICGNVSLFNVNRAIHQLVSQMMSNTPQNSRIMISMRAENLGDGATQSQLLSRSEMEHFATEWVNYFMEYKDLDIEDVEFKLLVIDVPAGAGKRVNAIIDPEKKRSIIQIENHDTICLMRSILVGLTFHKEKLSLIFKNNLTDAEVAGINYKRRRCNYTRINEGIFTDLEIAYIKQGGERKIQTILAKALHRLYNIEIKEKGNDLSDI